MANEKVLKGPYWTRNWIEAMWRFTNENFVDFDTGAIDYEALGKEEFQFRKALFFRNFKNSERAKMAFASAKDDYKNSVENGKKGGRPKKSPQDAPNGNAGGNVSDAGNGAASKSPTSCDTFTADGDTREDSQAKPDGSAITRNETRAHDALEPSANIYGDGDTREDSRGRYAPPSCSPDDGNHYGDAPRREAGEVVNSRESGAALPTTVSENMRRVPQNEAPAHGFSGGRTAQGTMSRSPEAPAQSGKDYGTRQASIRSTDDPQPEGLTGPSHGGSVASLEAQQCLALESQRRAGGNSLRVAKVRTPPVRSSGPMPADKQEVYDFAAAEGLDTADAYECWHVTVNERDGLTADGKPIKNWKAYVRKWCETRACRRNA